MSKVRQPCVAGQFYDGDAVRLKANIARMAEGCRSPEISGRPRALVLPHAGYVFSGPTAVRALLTAQNFSYSKALLLAPSHRVAFRGVAAADYDVYATPLGDMSVDTAANKRLLADPDELIINLPEAHEHEHSLEVELPLIRELLSPELKIIPLICGQLNDRDAMSIAGYLKDFFTPDTIWIISSDFTHYGRAFNFLPFTERIPSQLRALDMGAVRKILDFDPAGFASYCRETGATICGADPIGILLHVLKLNGGKNNFNSKLIDYSNSGDMTGDLNHCVSYASLCFSDKA